MRKGEAVQACGGLAQSEEGGMVVYVSEDLKEELFWELIEIALCGGHFEVIQTDCFVLLLSCSKVTGFSNKAVEMSRV